ncbi:MAG: ricin-type beta-trefoil lectin domain protein [Saccharospirillaceae bacterium]|nr:ricin-type beta-trefoil lectin domain protein [Pseudomonadales bacterium]NRB78159.1 ricin-type beta-trefoil lectin domain protein [Saccharospirillaceae bacterium]
MVINKYLCISLMVGITACTGKVNPQTSAQSNNTESAEQTITSTQFSENELTNLFTDTFTSTSLGVTNTLTDTSLNKPTQSNTETESETNTVTESETNSLTNTLTQTSKDTDNTTSTTTSTTETTTETSRGTDSETSTEIETTNTTHSETDTDIGTSTQTISTTQTSTQTTTEVDTSELTVLYSVQNQSLCLSLDLDNSNIAALSCDDSNKQKWLMDNNEIRSADNTNQCITAASLSSGADLFLSNCDNSENQNWHFENNMISHDNYVFDLNTNNNNVIVYAQHGGSNQQWLTQLPKASDSFTYLTDVPAQGPYGSRTFKLTAAQNWVNVGLYLHQGESATIDASGSWTVSGGVAYGPDGNNNVTKRGCQEGELVARIGLAYKDERITCIGSGGTINAHTDGIVFIAAVSANDLGESYETKKNAYGELDVTVTSDGQTVPVVLADEAEDYDFTTVLSGWVDIMGEFNIVTMPTNLAILDQPHLKSALDRLDFMYNSHYELRGRKPYFGQIIRWFPDTDAPGWMLAGPVIRMDGAITSTGSTIDTRITRIAAEGVTGWGFAHELGHIFNFAGGDWVYVLQGGLEGWPNVFSVYTLEKLGLSQHNNLNDCPQKKATYIGSNNYDDNLGGPWNALCFLLELKDNHGGWDTYKKFYQEFNTNPGKGWSFLRQRFNDASGEDTTATFDSWLINL